MKRLLLATTCLLVATTASAQTAAMQSPAYQECTALAASTPEQALAKADAWLKIDAGLAAQHCRAMALYGLSRFPEAGDALSAVRGMVTPENITLRGYVARQAARAYMNANAADKAYGMLDSQIAEVNSYKGDNAAAAHLTADLLLDRARLGVTFGKLEDAAKDLDHAVSLTPLNEEVLLERAGVFEKLGDKALAASDAQSVLKLNSSNSKARELLARLGGAQQGAGISAPANVTAQPVATEATAAGAAPQPATAKPAGNSTSKRYWKKRSSKKHTAAVAAPATPATQAP